MLEQKGYDKEEEYFYKLNKELLEKRRKELDAKKDEQKAAEAKSMHWMKCPKCGKDMEEISLEGISVDRCTACQGVYFDAGELDTLLAAREPQGFLGRLGRALGTKS